MSIPSIRKAVIAVVAAVALAQASFAQEPANKPGVAINRGQLTFVSPNQTQRLLQEVVKTSKPTDLLLSVTAESSIITTLRTMGDDMQSADGTLSVYITIDGVVVTPSGPNPPGPGNPRQGDTAEVVFANQTYRRSTTLGADDATDTIETYLQTKHASGFNWAVLNVGSGIHTIEVFATYTQDVTADATAQGVIGNRSLVVQPIKCQVNEAVVDGSVPTPLAPITLN